MNRSKLNLLSWAAASVLALTISAGVKAQTADDVINKHLAAIGGKEKFAAIKTLYTEGTAVAGNGMEITTKSWKVKDQLFRQEVNFGMGSVTIIVTPTKGWASNPQSGGEFKPIPDDQLKQMQSQLDPSGPLVDYAAKGNKVELTGKDTVGGKDCYKIKVTPATGADITFWIDASTYYILRENRKGGGMMGGGGGQGGNGGGRRGGGEGGMNIEFSDYKKTPDGYVFPFTIVVGGMGVKSNVEKVEVNGTVDVAGLSKPGN